MKSLCGFISTRYNQNDILECESDEYYTDAMMTIALFIAGFEYVEPHTLTYSNTPTKKPKDETKKPKDEPDKSITIDDKNDRFRQLFIDILDKEKYSDDIMYLILLSKGHWVSFRKIKEKYYYFDSLISNYMKYNSRGEFHNYILTNVFEGTLNNIYIHILKKNNFKYITELDKYVFDLFTWKDVKSLGI